MNHNGIQDTLDPTDELIASRFADGEALVDLRIDYRMPSELSVLDVIRRGHKGALKEIDRLRTENEDLRGWLDVATNAAGIAEHAMDSMDYHKERLAAVFSAAHLPSDAKKAEIKAYLEETFERE